MLDQALWLTIAAQYCNSIILHFTSPAKDQSPKFEVQFTSSVYSFYNTVSLKISKLNHFKYRIVVSLVYFLGYINSLILCYKEVFKDFDDLIEEHTVQAGPGDMMATLP